MCPVKRNEILDLLKIPEEVANKAHVHELTIEIKRLNGVIDNLENKIYRLTKDCENKSIALKRRRVQIEDLKSELHIVNQFLDPKHK